MRILAGLARIVFGLLGVLALAMGALWIGQGLGWIMWPSSSFMLQQPEWAVYGAFLGENGLLLLVLVLWIGRRRAD